ncbi:MAG: exo-alpha-sialidase [Bryobacterales bacterium]|nr:exo-alpha-sialidase [Bryobacterales bacterium]
MTRRKLLVTPLITAAASGKTTAIRHTPPAPVVSAAGVHYGFPRIVRAANGHLLLFYRIGTTHAYDYSSVAMRRSPDNGNTWSAEKVLFRDPDTARSAHNPVAVVAADKRVILWVSRFRFSPTPHRREPGAWAWSDDHGESWSPFETFDTDASRSSYYMTDVIRTSDGLLGSNATFPPSGIGNCYALQWHSADNGRTWKVRSQLTAPEANRGDEVGLIERSPGEILCLLRTRRQPGSAGYPKGLSVFVSTDHGSTWNEQENLFTQLGITLQRPFLTRLDRSRVLLSGRDVERKQIVAFLSRDNARTFGAKTVIDSYVKDGAYTSCVPLNGKRALMVYYADREGTLPELRATRIEVD